MTHPPVVLLPFDRSVDAEAAVDRVVELVPDADLTVMTIWRPTVPDAVDDGRGLDRPPTAGAGGRESADARASLGARHAAAAGLRAHARCQRATSDVVGTIVAVADELDADLIVLGRHGRSGGGYAEIGATVRGVLQRTGRTVLVVSGHDVPHHPDPPGPTGVTQDTPGHGGTRVGAWTPATPDDERDGAW